MNSIHQTLARLALQVCTIQAGIDKGAELVAGGAGHSVKVIPMARPDAILMAGLSIIRMIPDG